MDYGQHKTKTLIKTFHFKGNCDCKLKQTAPLLDHLWSNKCTEHRIKMVCYVPHAIIVLDLYTPRAYRKLNICSCSSAPLDEHNLHYKFASKCININLCITYYVS